MVNISIERIKELEKVVQDYADYIKGCLGSSYCETGEDDWKELHRVESILGIEETKKSSFY